MDEDKGSCNQLGLVYGLDMYGACTLHVYMYSVCVCVCVCV